MKNLENFSGSGLNMKITKFQNIILRAIKNEYKSCSDIAFEIKKNKIHVGNSVKALLDKKIIDVWYNYPENPKYIFHNETQIKEI